MATIVVVFKILFLVLIAHSFVAVGIQHHQASSVVTSNGDSASSSSSAAVLASSSYANLFKSSKQRNSSRKDNNSNNSNNDNDNGGSQPDVSARHQFQAAAAARLDDSSKSSQVAATFHSGADDEETATLVHETTDHELGDHLAVALKPQHQAPISRIGQQAPPRSTPFPAPAAVTEIAATSTTAATINYAELCYLSNGGSSLTLTVNEATQVGSIIGTVDVNGDPSLEGGNVNLFDALEPQQQQLHWPSQAANRTEQSQSTSSPPIHSAKQRRLLGRRSTSATTAGAELPNGGGDESDSAVQLQSPYHKISHRSPARLFGLVTGDRDQRSLGTNQQQALGGGGANSFYSLIAGTAPTNVAQQQQPPPVRLVPGTRNLVLIRALDKESVEGEQSLVINVRCTPRSPVGLATAAATATTNNGDSLAVDSTTIPVRLIVTDANDHAPEFVGALPYVVNVSETTPIGAVISRDILAQDRDSAGPHSTLHYRVLEDGSPHSALLQFANPLDPTLLVAGQLDFETLPSFTITIVAQDQGEPEPLSASAQVHVNIIDFDDQNPKFLDDKYSLIMDDAQQNLVGQNLQVLPRNLYAEDGDRGIGAPIVYSFDQLGGGRSSGNSDLFATGAVAADVTATGSGTAAASEDQFALNVERYLHLNPSSGEIRLIRQWPQSWTGGPVTLVVRATQADNKDRYTLTTLTISKPAAATRVSNQQQQTARARQQVSENGGDSGRLQPQQQQARSQGIEFTPDRLSIDVPESVPINEKIARVRARYSAGESSRTPTFDGQADSQAVDLVQESTTSAGAAPANNSIGSGGSSSVATSKLPIRGNSRSKEHGVESTPFAQLLNIAANNKRPINYQILDDQTDQFGINGLGEIFVKRPLDYELRQEYKFRVLATYTKYSDICQVQVSVQNVNDNKPKFAQPQYSFHVTESRIRSNVIGTVQAHDADLNDTLRYTLLGDQAHLFDISSAGQISLRPGTRQLNISSCQLTVQAHDTLPAGPTGRFPPAQARVNIQIAPQLVGRSLSLESGQPIDKRQASGDWTTAPPGGRRFHLSSSSRDEQLLSSSSSDKDLSSSGVFNQRSSVATVVSSLQHMVRGSNLLDMPMSSALVLSAVLALLICLLFIILISMSAHLCRRRAKARHRNHLAAASRLRHQAQMAAAAAVASSSQAAAAVAGTRYQTDAAAPQVPSSSASISSSPTNSTAAGGSPNYLGSPRQVGNLAKTAASISNKLNGGARPSSVADGAGRMQQSPRVSTISGRLSAQNICSSGQLVRSGNNNNNTVAAKNKQLIMLTGETQTTSSGEQDKATNATTSNEFSLLTTSSLSSSHSKRSYQSNTTDNSSVMHCGHYSINASCQLSPPSSAANHATATPSERISSAKANINALNQRPAVAVSLMDHEDIRQEDDRALDNKLRLSANVQQQLRLNNKTTNELGALTSGRPGIKSYRKLPPLGSLARPIKSLATADYHQTAVAAQDSAIGSDESASGSNHPVCSPSNASQQRQGLMAMIRGPDQRRPNSNLDNERQRPTSSTSQHSLLVQQQQSAVIRWPQGSAPQRVKKLTWDDELSITNNEPDDCFVAPDLPPIGGPISPLGSQHHYPIDRLGREIGGQFVEQQHFLFSNPCSPAPNDEDEDGSGAHLEQSDEYFDRLPPLATELGSGGTGNEQHHSSIMGQNNCFDYTIVQSSQFRPDNKQHQQHQPQARWPPASRTSYMYSNSNINSLNNNNSNHHHQQTANQPQDLKLMTAAAL